MAPEAKKNLNNDIKKFLKNEKNCKFCQKKLKVGTLKP